MTERQSVTTFVELARPIFREQSQNASGLESAAAKKEIQAVGAVWAQSQEPSSTLLHSKSRAFFEKEKLYEAAFAQTQFNGDTAEGALEKALGYYADFLNTPQAKALQPDVRLKPVPAFTLGGFDHAAFQTWLLRGHLDG